MDKAWKAHEREVARFFGTERSKQSLTHDYRLTGTSPSDVIVNVQEWLEPDSRFRPPEPFRTIVCECKHTSDVNHWRGKWCGRFIEYYRSVPPNIFKEGRKPILMLRDGWGLCRLGDFYSIYRGVFATKATGKKWMRQLFTKFWIQVENRSAPKYFSDWLGQTKAHNKDILGATLEINCMGSPAALRGPGGGKVVIFSLHDPS
jgi:hypothetical protein